MGNSKGITLIALVITIIVLIILAGVSINILLGQNGLIEKAKNSKEKYEIEQILEQLELVKANLKLDNIEFTIDNYLARLEESNNVDFILDERVDDDNAYIIVNNNYKYLLEHEESGNLKITYEGTTNGLKSNIVTYYVDTDVSYQEKVTKYQTCLLPKTFSPSKEGYTFVGWREDTTASEEILETKKMGDNEITLYAVFSKEVTITYNGNENTDGETQATTGLVYYNNGNKESNVILAENGFSKTDAIFSKWAMSSIDGETYNPGDNVSIVDNIEFYAIWQDNITTYEYTGDMQTYIVPATGTYKLSVYGAQGGAGSSSSSGKGGYAYGNVELTKGTTIYICVGGKGTWDRSVSSCDGGYNGGGKVTGIGHQDSNMTFYGASGGGATHIGTFNSTLAEHGSTDGLFIVAGGGGGLGYWYGNPASNNYNFTSESKAGGTGGGTTGGKGSANNAGLGGTATGGGGSKGLGYGGSSFGKGSNAAYGEAAGGGGLYGGGSSWNGHGGRRRLRIYRWMY